MCAKRDKLKGNGEVVGRASGVAGGLAREGVVFYLVLLSKKLSNIIIVL